jgi:hypothetical protein
LKRLVRIHDPRMTQTFIHVPNSIGTVVVTEGSIDSTAGAAKSEKKRFFGVTPDGHDARLQSQVVNTQSP